MSNYIKKPAPSDTMYLRLSQIIGHNGIIPISRSTFYAKVKAGELPAPTKLGPRISVWRRSDIIAFIEHEGGNDE